MQAGGPGFESPQLHHIEGVSIMCATHELTVGKAVQIAGCLGRITSMEGGILFVTTPHGSVIKSGMVWVRRILPNSKEALRLENFERDAKAKNKIAYCF